LRELKTKQDKMVRQKVKEQKVKRKEGSLFKQQFQLVKNQARVRRQRQRESLLFSGENVMSSILYQTYPEKMVRLRLGEIPRRPVSPPARLSARPVTPDISQVMSGAERSSRCPVTTPNSSKTQTVAKQKVDSKDFQQAAELQRDRDEITKMLQACIKRTKNDRFQLSPMNLTRPKSANRSQVDVEKLFTDSRQLGDPKFPNVLGNYWRT
jgi:hypothetical protein